MPDIGEFLFERAFTTMIPMSGESRRLIYGMLRSLEVGKFKVMEAYLRESNPPTATALGRGGSHGASSVDAMPTTTATVQTASHGTQVRASLFIEVCLLHRPDAHVYFDVWQVQRRSI